VIGRVQLLDALCRSEVDCIVLHSVVLYLILSDGMVLYCAVL
jgi:hypothetical protein